MSIHKIIKSYFVFLMILASLAIVTTNQSVEGMLSSVFHSSKQISQSPFTVMAANSFETDIESGLMKLITKPNNDFILEVSNNPEKHFAEPASIDNELMKLTFKANKDAEIDALKLKLVGTESSNVGRITLVDEDTIVAVGKRDDEYFYFKGIDFSMKSGESKSLILKVSISSALKPSDRFRMDIENSEDIEIKVEGSSYTLKMDFPVVGPYLTVSKNREWGPFKSKKDK